MPSNFRANDPYVNEQVDLDDVFITDAWLVDQFVGGTLFGWGRNDQGQAIPFPPYAGTNYLDPVQVASLVNWKQVSVNGQFSMAVKTDGTLWGWGINNKGQLGNGNIIGYTSPIQIGSLTNWKQVACAYNGFMAVKTDGTLWGCGYNFYGQLGNSQSGNSFSSPIQVGSLTNWKQVARRDSSTAAIKTDGTLWTWGYNTSGQLGNGTVTNYSSPIQIGLLTNWKQVATGVPFMAAIKTDGTLWTWGGDGYGNIGNGTTVSYSSPIQIGSLTNWSQISAGGFPAAIKTDGTLWVWGYNGYGGLGNGTAIAYSSPIQIGSLTNWKQVSPGAYHTHAIKTDGTLWSWGHNSISTFSGFLGNGTTIKYSSPIQIGALTNWKQVSAGYYNGSAITFTDLG